jgi:hypothetical protein
MAYTLLDIATEIGGAQPALIDAVTAPNGGALFRKLPMKAVLGLSEQFIRRTGRPTVSFRPFAADVVASKSKKVPMREGIFLLSGASEMDAQMIDKAANPTQERVDETMAFLEALGFQLSTSAFYGSNRVDGGYDGLMKRLPIGCDTYVDGGATEETYSIYAFKFGPTRFMGIYNPFENGDIIEAHDYGKQSVKENGAYNEYYITMFNAFFGFAQYHPLSIGRIGRLDVNHKPQASQLESLFAQMKGKPDLLVCHMQAAGWLNELKMNVMKMDPTMPDFDITMGDYAGIPIITDSAVVSNESAITL